MRQVSSVVKYIYLFMYLPIYFILKLVPHVVFGLSFTLIQIFISPFTTSRIAFTHHLVNE